MIVFLFIVDYRLDMNAVTNEYKIIQLIVALNHRVKFDIPLQIFKLMK